MPYWNGLSQLSAACHVVGTNIAGEPTTPTIDGCALADEFRSSFRTPSCLFVSSAELSLHFGSCPWTVQQMSTLVASPVAVDLPRILASEGPSPSSTASRPNSGAARSAPRVQPAGGLPTESTRPPRYSPPPNLQPIHPPSLRPEFPRPTSHTRSHAYYSAQPASFPPGPPEPPYLVSAPPGFIPVKRSPPSDFTEPAPKKQSKWTEDEDDMLITLRGENMKWEEIAKHVPGRSAIACRLHYQNFLERRAAWDEEKKNKLAQLYNRSVNV